uniref:Uncharacterized protein n=1 Tax=Zea mays TaxID=4577 RepID=C0PLA3_MAIZE|nr:unknown [Zea mays]ACR34892.1 unknown [Zea mays]
MRRSSWTKRSTRQGMARAPWCRKPYSRSASSSSAPKSGCLRWPSGTANRRCSSPSRPTRTVTHPLGAAAAAAAVAVAVMCCWCFPGMTVARSVELSIGVACLVGRCSVARRTRGRDGLEGLVVRGRKRRATGRSWRWRGGRR